MAVLTDDEASRPRSIKMGFPAGIGKKKSLKQ
jgi:hypothetical protein